MDAVRLGSSAGDEPEEEDDEDRAEDGDEDGIEHAACGRDAQGDGDAAAYDCADDAQDCVHDEAVA